MDCEITYKEALERIKMRRLAESEDERIRNCICICLTDASEERFNDFHTTLKDCFAWIEKQGKQKLIDKVEHECSCKYVGCHINNSRRWCHYLENELPYDRCNSYCPKYNKKPTEWSDEDDAYKEFAISAVEDYYNEENPLQKELVDWLKSLKDRVKPKQEWSEEDEKMFDFCCDYLDDNQIAFLEKLKARVQGKEG